MAKPSAKVFSLAMAAMLGLSITGRAADPRPKGPPLSAVHLEVAALETLYRFQLTAQQMEALRRMAPDTLPKEKQREPGKGSDQLRRLLLDYREALIRGDEDRIIKLQEQVDDLLEAPQTDLDDEIEITSAARRVTAEVMKTINPRQLAAFLNALPEELPDPLERLLEALDLAGTAKDAEWKVLVEEIVDELSWQLGGVDAERSRFVGERIAQFLKLVRSLGPTQLGKQRAELEQAARQSVGTVPAAAVLHNVAEHALAELLSNPRLLAALDARMKK